MRHISYTMEMCWGKWDKRLCDEGCFGIIPEHINNLNELVKTFLRLYYKNMELPKVLSDYLEYKLKQKENLKDVPLNEILSGKDRFLDL